MRASAPTIVSFTTVGTTTWTVPAGVTVVDYLVVGGGGGGGAYGGGGAGGFLTGSLYTTPGASLTVVVGAGGTGSLSASTNGGNSKFGSVTALGGGYGSVGSAGGNGGSGGGGPTGGTGTAGQGNNGGSTGTYAFGGGGGASAAGVSPGSGTNGGNGGAGSASSITGSSVTYAGGGGGTGRGCCGSVGGTGGAGGGGNGGNGVGTIAPTSGTANTGGGGGGDYDLTPGSGGSGIVVISYSPSITFTGNVKFNGNLAIVGSLTKGSGTFEIDDPIDPANKILFHSFVESPDALNIYDGIATLDDNGEVTIPLPDYYDDLNQDSTYQYSPLDQSMPDLYVKTEEADNQFTIAGGVPGGQVSWQISGVRHDPYLLANPIIPEVEKGPGQLVDKGFCIYAPDCE